MSYVSIFYIISGKDWLESRCGIDKQLETSVTINIHTLWHSYPLFCPCLACVWVLGGVDDHIHPAAGSPRGEGGNVIYTLIMPAPLNTPLDRCNILDISSSFLFPLSPSFPSFHLDPTYIPSPMLIFALLIMNTEQCRHRGAAVICVCERVHVCVQNEQNRTNTGSLPLSASVFFSSGRSLPPSKCIH